MTVDELFERVVRSHLWLLAVCLLLPVTLVGYAEYQKPLAWDASVRIQVDTAEMSSSTQAESLSSRVLAVVTTPRILAEAMDDAGITGDPVTIAGHEVTAQRLGESPVVEITVTQPDALRAGALVKALAQRLITFLNQQGQQGSEEALTKTTTRLAKARKQYDDAVGLLAAARTPADQARATGELQSAAQLVGGLLQQQLSLENNASGHSQAIAIDADTPQVVKVSSSLIPRVSLALLLGLCLGLALSAALETIRPRVPSTRALARLLEAPMVGSAHPRSLLVGEVARTARRQGVDLVVVVPADPRDAAHADALVAELSRGTARTEPSRPAPPDGSYDVDTMVGVQPMEYCTLGAVPVGKELTAGVLVCSTGNVLRARIDQLSDTLAAACWPVIGVVDPQSGWGEGA